MTNTKKLKYAQGQEAPWDQLYVIYVTIILKPLFLYMYKSRHNHTDTFDNFVFLFSRTTNVGIFTLLSLKEVCLVLNRKSGTLLTYEKMYLMHIIL